MPFIALVSIASMVDLLRFRPAPLANLATRKPSGFAKAAREEAKPGGLEFSGADKAIARKVFAALAAVEVFDEPAESKEEPWDAPSPRRSGSSDQTMQERHLAHDERRSFRRAGCEYRKTT